MENVFDVLRERGFVQRTTHDDEIRALFETERVFVYIGFDPTAESLHAGHLLQIFAMMHMQQHGHVPIFLIGGGTGLIGDPSHRQDMGRMISKTEIQRNSDAYRKLFNKFIDFSDGKAIVVNNAEWLVDFNYFEFLKDVGSHYTVGRMLDAECYRYRMLGGLTFPEFNYMLMQSYDFLELHRRYNCKVELGGDDQWSNIAAGVDLIKSKLGVSAYGMTIPLLTGPEGKKMGKNERGTIWLDPRKTSPECFYQNWMTVDDSAVKKYLQLLTFLPMDEIDQLTEPAAAGSDASKDMLEKAKAALAYEVTTLVHGEEEAAKAQAAYF